LFSHQAFASFLVNLAVAEEQVLVPRKSTQHSQVQFFLQEVRVVAAKAATATNNITFFIGFGLD